MKTVITYFTTLLKLCVVFKLLKILHAVPPNYCLQNLNKSDCNVPPVSVFSYYKPGSRCEIEEWRGCPSENKFDTERECIHVCIKRIGLELESSGLTPGSSTLNGKCYEPVNLYNCNNNATKAFVYNKAINKCVEIIWTGCPHKGNVFEEQLDCLETCYRGDLNWNEKMNMISDDLADQIESILDNISIEDSVDSKEIANIDSTTFNNVTEKKILLSKMITKSYKDQKIITSTVKGVNNKTEKLNNFTMNTIDMFIETTSTTKSGKKSTEIATAKANLNKTIDTLNYPTTTEYVVTINTEPKTEDAKEPHSLTTIRDTTTTIKSTTPKITKSTTPNVTTTPKATKSATIESTTPKTTESTTIVTATPNVTKSTLTQSTTDKVTKTSTTESSTSVVTTTTIETTVPTTKRTTTVKSTTTEERTTPKTIITTTPFKRGTAKEVVLPQDLY